MTGKQKRQTKAQILQATKVAVRLNPEAYLKNASGQHYVFTCRRRRRGSMRCTLPRGHSGPHISVYKFYNSLECEVYGVWWSDDQKLRDYEQSMERLGAERRKNDLSSDAGTAS